jgi:hypothetical protein
MKKLLLFALAVTLAACSAAPTQAPVVQPAAPEPVVVTVVVEPTQAAPEPVVVTVVVEATPIPPTAAPPTEAPAATADTQATGVIPIDDVLGKGVFVNMTVSDDEFALRCLPREITFNITTNLPDIVDAELNYRTVDQPKALYYSEWKRAGKLETDKKGNFWITFSGEDVDPNLRLDVAWFEFQFVGLNKGGGVVDRTQKIEKMVTYRIDCP